MWVPLGIGCISLSHNTTRVSIGRGSVATIWKALRNTTANLFQTGCPRGAHIFAGITMCHLRRCLAAHSGGVVFRDTVILRYSNQCHNWVVGSYCKDIFIHIWRFTIQIRIYRERMNDYITKKTQGWIHPFMLKTPARGNGVAFPPPQCVNNESTV